MPKEDLEDKLFPDKPEDVDLVDDEEEGDQELPKELQNHVYVGDIVPDEVDKEKMY